MGEGDVMRGLAALFERDFGTDLAQWLSYRTVWIQGDMTGVVGGPVAAHAQSGQRQPEARWYLHRFGQHKAEVL